MPSAWSHVLLVADIMSMRIFVCVLGHLSPGAIDLRGGILDSDLFFYDRYSDLAEYHRAKGHIARADRLTVIAEGYYSAAPDDDDEPEAAAIAMPVRRPRINTNAVSSIRVPRPPDASHGLAPSAAH
jgi:hypothetical protein